MTLTLPMRSPDPAVAALRRRLRPLHAAVFLQGFMLWVPVEKLFMTEIGFDAASIGVMAAAYSALVPLLELPSGILADRWSRRGVLILSSVALASARCSAGSATNVTTYVISALLFGVYFACYSGTLDSVVYDTVLEETGDGGDFERRIGRVQAVEAVALVASALAGGWVAGLLEPRVTYFLTVPFALASIAAYARFREPRLHRAAEPVALRRHLGADRARGDPAPAVAADRHARRAGRGDQPVGVRVRSTVAGRAGRAGRRVRAVLGRAGVHARLRRAARRPAAAGPAGQRLGRGRRDDRAPRCC